MTTLNWNARPSPEGVRVITRGQGVYLWDSDGKKIIDGMAGLWCVQVGYGNEELAEAGYEALKTLPYYNHFYSPIRVPRPTIPRSS